MNTNRKKDIRYIIEVSIFISLVVVFSFIRFPVGESSIHLGNGMCLLAGLLISPVAGGMASGFGSVIFDVLGHPSTFAFEFVITFITKFLMGWSCGMLFNMINKKNSIVALIVSGIFGEIIYIVCYLLKSYFVNIYVVGINKTVIMPILLAKLSASSFNAVVAVIMATILYGIVKSIKEKEFF